MTFDSPLAGFIVTNQLLSGELLYRLITPSPVSTSNVQSFGSGSFN